MPKQLINIIENSNIETKTIIQIGKDFSGEIKSNTGIRQGDSLNPMLYNLIVNKIIDSVRRY